jgi:hypothetical protein
MLLLYLALAIASLRGEHDLVRVCPPPPSASRPSGQSRLEAAPKPPASCVGGGGSWAGAWWVGWSVLVGWSLVGWVVCASRLEPGGLGGLC